jgi:alpha-L-fucosidase
VVYAFQMKWPADGKTLIKAFARKTGSKVAAVELLGFGGRLTFVQGTDGLHVAMPAEQVGDYVHCLRLQLE